MLGLYECILSTAVIFLELFSNLFALCAALTKAGLVYVLLSSDFFLLDHALGVIVLSFLAILE